jgi:hypothetical protein
MLQKADKKEELAPFHIPQAVGFNGACMNAVGVQFLKDIDQSSCQQYILDL